MTEQPSEWSLFHKGILQELHPLLEAVLGKTEFPPSRQTVEGFIDLFSRYGFHCFDAANWGSIDSSGLLQEVCSPTYFIADRRISFGDILSENAGDYLISAQEYFNRFFKSESMGTCLSLREFEDILVFNRKTALELLNNESNTITERRGAGFFGVSATFDEGYFQPLDLRDNCSAIYIPRKSIIGTLSSRRGNRAYYIIAFFSLVVEDFLRTKQPS